MATAAPQRTSAGCTSSAAPRSTRRVDLEEAADPPRQPASWAQTPAARAAQARRLGCRVRPAKAPASRSHRGRVPQVPHLLAASQVRTCMPTPRYGTCAESQPTTLALPKQSMVLALRSKVWYLRKKQSKKPTLRNMVRAVPQFAASTRAMFSGRSVSVPSRDARMVPTACAQHAPTHHSVIRPASGLWHTA